MKFKEIQNILLEDGLLLQTQAVDKLVELMAKSAPITGRCPGETSSSASKDSARMGTTISPTPEPGEQHWWSARTVLRTRMLRSG